MLRKGETPVTSINRQYAYIDSGAETLFGWLHTPTTIRSGALAAVICSPLGVEYMSGYRSIRRLADELALSGMAALRFDYAFTGDSTGGDFRHATREQFVADICNAVTATRTLTSAPQIALIGIGLGATFAALASNETAVDRLVLWNPTVSGKRFIREQRLLSDVLSQDDDREIRVIDSSGIYLTEDLQDQFRSIDLTALPWDRHGRVLVISRSDMNSHKNLRKILSQRGVDFEHAALAGYKEMMDQPTETVVPVDTIQFIRNWLGRETETTNVAATPMNNLSSKTPEICEQVSVSDGEFATSPLREVPAWFGHDQSLFGIATIPSESEHGKTRAFLFLNCGSEHHAGPHRLYTKLARRIASHGNIAFRFDIEGIGDSVSIGNNAENNSYSPTALTDIDQAIHYLKVEYGCNEFILSGICAGAYHAFKAAAEISGHEICEANLINPLVFEWNYENPDDHLQYEIHTYWSAMKSPRDWWRLLAGKIEYRRLFRTITSHLLQTVRRVVSDVVSILTRKAVRGLPKDLQTLRNLNRPLTLILSEGDPGLDIMKFQARRATRTALRDGKIRVIWLANANHGLSKRFMQDQLVSTFINKYCANS